MIGRLQGEIIEKRPPHLLVDVQGVGYEVEAPMSTFYELPDCGQNVALYTHLLVRDDAHTLYAFKHVQDRSLFRNLLKVNGVGAKVALAILSGMDAIAFANYVHNGDAESLTRLPGIGRKTAERLIIDMRDRLDMTSSVGTSGDGKVMPRHGSAVEDALTALISLGYKPREANRMVDEVETHGRDSEAIIRLALKSRLS